MHDIIYINQIYICLSCWSAKKRSKKAKTKHSMKALKQFKMCGHRMGNGMRCEIRDGGQSLEDLYANLIALLLLYFLRWVRARRRWRRKHQLIVNPNSSLSKRTKKEITTSACRRLYILAAHIIIQYYPISNEGVSEMLLIKHLLFFSNKVLR